MKILTVVGARPQFIKAATVSRVIKNVQGIEEIIVHTGQHYDKNMSSIFFEELDIPSPDYNLCVGSGSHGRQTAMMLIKVEEVIQEHRPDYVLVYGDTNSTLAGALASTKIHIPVAHVEAGLRSYNMFMPEEQNRVLTDHVSSFLFCPTENAVNNLKRENIYNGKLRSSKEKIYVSNTGDVMYDALLFNIDILEEKSKILETLDLEEGTYILGTVHRAENTNSPQRFSTILDLFGNLSDKVILPLHPRTKKYLIDYDIRVGDNITIIEPVGYFDILNLEKHAKAIFTDSGGMQKEAFFLKVPCFTLRNETEWIETLEEGWNRLVKFGGDSDSFNITRPSLQKNFFGDGNAAEKIVDYIMNKGV
ncbi:MAG: UDP-N-acetylglucosamine 2-epimerase (non-hydrolyzing) [bacterium]|nr:UDP-N-acetylglucosamine 2-epimerase (non-hydrolyzing) [bacterium]